MSKIITSVFVFLIACIDLYGQQAIKVEYNYHFFTVRGYEVNRPMILTSSNTKSKFYNPDTNRIDSICSTPAGKAEYEKYFNNINWTSKNHGNHLVRWEKMYVEKDRETNEMTVYDTVAGEERYYYNESLNGINWEMKDSTERILGYDCQMAECDYHGRHWEVWFTPDIPIADGPWKLNGLPGLILKANEDAGQYEFTVVGIESYDRNIEPVYQKYLYSHIDRKELLRTKRLIDENMGGFISARTGINLPNNMSSLKINKDIDYLETDYHQP